MIYSYWFESHGKAVMSALLMLKLLHTISKLCGTKAYIKLIYIKLVKETL